MLKQFWQWLKGNLAYDVTKYVLESKLIMSAISAGVAGFIVVWNNYGPLVLFFAILLAASLAANLASDISAWRKAIVRGKRHYLVPAILLGIGLIGLWYWGGGYEVTLDQAMPNHSALFRQWNAIPLTEVDQRVFHKTTVVLDGKRFKKDCVFDNVQFVFNGTAPYKVGGCRIMGKNSISTGNPSLEQFAILFLQLRFYNPGVSRELLK